MVNHGTNVTKKLTNLPFPPINANLKRDGLARPNGAKAQHSVHVYDLKTSLVYVHSKVQASCSYIVGPCLKNREMVSLNHHHFGT